MCYGNNARNFLTKKEKMEMLQEYKEDLEQEVKGVGERLAELKNEE